MAVKPILEYPDPRLRELSAPVEVFDDSVEQSAFDLIDTLHASSSIGLSAPQIDDRRQILVMDHSDDQSEPEVFINPEVLTRQRYGFVEERCLSVPGIKAMVFRATQITIRAYSIKGEVFERALNDMPAVCLQHEMDHFKGKLLADRVNWFKRRKLRSAVKQT
jgi:peptide deformylase